MTDWKSELQKRLMQRTVIPVEMTYAFGNKADRTEYAAECTFERCGVEYTMRETEEVIGTTTLYFLHLTRVSPTLKQMLTPGFKAQ